MAGAKESSIFKSAGVSPENRGESSDDSDGPRSMRMSEALKLRQSLNPSDGRRKLRKSDLASPRSAAPQQYEDTEELDAEIASPIRPRHRMCGGTENKEPENVKARYANRSALLSKLKLQGPMAKEAKTPTGGTLTSRVAFQNQLSSRFKSTTHPVQRLASSDNEEE